MVKAVVDTNVFISGLLNKGGIPRKIFLAFKEGKFSLFISQSILTEILMTLNKPEIAPLVTIEDRKELLIFLENFAKFVTPKEEVSVCRDPYDNVIIECAVAGNADFIVTGDKDLLIHKSFRGIFIIPPHKFLKILLGE